MNKYEQTLREDLDNLRTKAEFLQKIWDMRESIPPDLVMEDTISAEDGMQNGWSVYTTAAEMIMGAAEERRKRPFAPEQRASMIEDTARTLEESCTYMEVVKDYVMLILKTHLLRAETVMRSNGWKLPEWERCPWLDEVTGKG